jgi:hypothetical protein
MCTGETRLFSLSGVVASAFDTASTLEGSAEDSLGGSVGSFAGGGAPDCLDE